MTKIRPGHNALDSRLPHQPRDYLSEPHLFGSTGEVQMIMPPGGNMVALRAAEMQHLLVSIWRRLGRSQAELARRWDCSPQTVSDTVLGKRWAGSVLLSAMSEPFLRRNARPPVPPVGVGHE